MSLGQRMRNERENQGFSLDDVEQETKIRKLYINAIEEENFDILPERVYATGFVKRYARFLHLNEDEIVEEFKTLAYKDNETPKKENIEFVGPDSRAKGMRFSLKNLAIAAVFLVVVIWLGNTLVGYLTREGKPSDQVKPPVVEETQKQPSQPAVVKQAKVSITSVQKCWLQVKVDDVVQFEGIMQPGEQKDFIGKNKVNIHAGNAGGLSVQLNGKNLTSLGANGEVVQYEFLNNGAVNKL
jgi:cytoskeleton protein RodZ